MAWKVDFYSGVEDEILAMPPKIQARMIKLIELHGANLGPPHTDSMGDGLFEIRAKAQEGIGRGLVCYLKGQHVYVLRTFVKKTNKTPKKEIDLARERMREVKL
ncbi:type II toxin-antitoxin system RelE/ParE family toxin [Photobacterium kishitanii]|uniref:type II toxin-antitoxin system RelE/ParE family toxin n=1 Tax=Photobacterium kishitanii TaxID=318456 RepID=UPI000D15F91B|nr:type II toxin-antitoxin system RelE/ParE family toxin [Photobacterium kishitanii]PSW57401.1 type II toxin-antitoxin system RelE/ParE family toxin [Photobacterium kishitanii]